MTDKSIDVSEEVYGALRREQRSDESVNETLGRVLGLEAALTPDDDGAVEQGDIYQGSNGWTVYDKLAEEQSDDESLEDTMKRLNP
ncbi:hypothetical protein [Halococcoides cellulosivorans]|uniref:Uncharacterized protein n=1 Tax=Halococcoides cellulosivorans TaxID=1679096 RepID=A0A2R4X1Z2_9EURY|nr:hypothetical protein [Halococcoides cellulosivorans]AWB27817.1 hypothetical protein HARCEL1_08890 [Halococcoides cellulosivorans]